MARGGRQVISSVLVVVAAVAAGMLAGWSTAQFTGGATAGTADELLDGTRPIRAAELAQLARSRAAIGATWLANVSRDDGSFFYLYYPEDDRYDPEDYNEVRHAGVTYSLFQAYGADPDSRVLEAAEAAAGYIRANSEPTDAGRAYTYNGRMKLGGQALALVALLERRRVLDDSAYDDLIGELGEFMLSLELEDHPGRYYQSYENGSPSLEPDSDYYPGEALLAMTRLAQHFPDGPYLDHAVRAAQYLIYERDGDIPSAGRVPREDHWLTMALSELYRLRQDPAYVEVVYLQANSMVANQHSSAQFPMRIGGSALQSPINYTSTATKGEALVASWSLAAFTGDDAAADRYATAARRNAQFQLRVQYTFDNTQLLPRPAAVIGAWGKDSVDPWIRIDFVQHNISALLGVWSMTTEGDIPIAAVAGGP